jgi:hypothetical protein
MKAVGDYRSNWSGEAGTPELSSVQWNLLAIPAAVLAVMAVLQIIGFGQFKDWLDSIRVGWPVAVAIVVIVAELWGAVSLLRVPMSAVVRFMGVSLAVLVSGFWFIENLYLATSSGGQLPSSGYFGKYLNQQPGWWTIVEITVMLFWVVYAAELLKSRPNNR